VTWRGYVARTGWLVRLSLLLLSAAPSLRAQNTAHGVGLEVADPGRLGVTLVPALGIDHDDVRRVVEQEFAVAGVEMLEGEDPRENEVLVIWLGEVNSDDEASGKWSNLNLSYRMEFWRPVRYNSGKDERVIPGITWVMRGEGEAGYRLSDHSLTEAVCSLIGESVRSFLTEFFEANGETYAPPDGPPSGCP